MSRTPRTLAECRFTSGHAIAHLPQQATRTERIAGVLVAVAVGVLGALALVHWAAA